MATNRFSPQERYIPDYLKASHESLQAASNQAKALADSTKTTTTTTEREAQQGAGLGAGLGGIIGSVAGGALGSIVPGVGTTLGASIGGMLGGAAGGAIDGGGIGAAEGGAQGLGTGMAVGNSDAFQGFKGLGSSAETLNAANGMSGAINLSNNGSNGGTNIGTVRDAASGITDQYKVGAFNSGTSYYEPISTNGARNFFINSVLGGGMPFGS